MRPVERGSAPAGLATYEEMSSPLLKRLGRYCSYCEYSVPHAPHVEHIVPKKAYPSWRNRWDNLLVSCTYCNSRKGSKKPTPADIDNYLWPTRDNTTRAFLYTNIVPEVNASLTPPLQNQAALLRGLVKLGALDDDRAKTRAEVFVRAQYYFSKMSHAPDVALLRETIVDLAVATGFFSIWIEVFATDVDTRRALIKAFLGTAQDCFDPVTTAPVARPGGRL